MEKIDFHEPTVADIVQWLLKQDQNAPFRIEDADTNRTIDTFSSSVDGNGVVWVDAAEYTEMEGTRK